VTDEQERQELLALHAADPDDPELNYRCAVIHDRMGLEHEAVPYYERAIAGGLSGEDLRSAFLGLGSTFRAIGEYEKAIATLERGMLAFPEAKELVVFRAMALHNVGRSGEAVSGLLRVLAEGPGEGVERYRRAIAFYADHLDEVW
jgi:tetratricopeptide (TPR) repeat protein